MWSLAESKNGVNDDMINRLELMWQQLEVPSLQRFDFMCKYVRTDLQSERASRPVDAALRARWVLVLT